MFVRVYVLACEYICACVCDLCFPRIESGNHVKLLLNAPPPAAFTRRKRRVRGGGGLGRRVTATHPPPGVPGSALPTACQGLSQEEEEEEEVVMKVR